MSYRKITFILCLGVFLSYGRDSNAQSQTFNATGNGQSGLIQSFTVPPCATTITVVASGAQGGATGGLGAKIQGTFTCTPGEKINILVGQAGGSNDNSHGSGGGGSFITVASNDTILVIAGGGGGHGASGIDATSNGSATRIGQTGVGSGTAATLGGGGAAASGATGGVGCTNGSPAGGSTWAGGGGGFCGNGGTYNSGASYGGYSYTSGGLGGTPATGANAYGGFGGGSGAGDRGGGGGGYSGGAGGTSNTVGGGGGGSYNAGTNQINTTGGAASGNGVVVIYWNATQVSSASGNIISNIVCGGSNTGKASLLVNNLPGPSNLTYSWSPNVSTRDTATGLSAGTYVITVSGCGTASASVTITQPASMVVNVATTGNVSCNGQANGSASSTVVGGTQPYIYSWTPSGGNAAIANGLTAGTYTLSVVDNHGCTGSGSVIITQPTALSVTIGAPTNEACFGQSVGAASAKASGGTLPYTYAWTNGSTTNSATGLSAGVYNL
ncbi:MAG TPA: SprB repeat-containing protein, partial [Candidatus Saccharimonadales bacterium]